MNHGHSLKKLAASELDSAVAKAEHYRDLNQPEEAESICHDVLAVSERHQHALRVLGLAVTDRFDERIVGLFEQAMAVFARLDSEYERTYLEGVAWERLGKAHIKLGEAHGALTAIEHAIEHFTRAEKLAPQGNPDPILRYNRCVRLLELPLLEQAYEAPHSRAPGLGD